MLLIVLPPPTYLRHNYKVVQQSICQVRLVTERGPVTFMEDFDEEDPVVSVVLLSK